MLPQNGGRKGNRNEKFHPTPSTVFRNCFCLVLACRTISMSAQLLWKDDLKALCSSPCTQARVPIPSPPWHSFQAVHNIIRLSVRAIMWVWGWECGLQNESDYARWESWREEREREKGSGVFNLEPWALNISGTHPLRRKKLGECH